MKRELTLADIAGYLPHKLQIQSQFGGEICTANIWNLQGAILANFKPILRPMSDLYVEITEWGYDPAAWVGNDPGGIAEVGDLFVSMADMLTDIDRDAPEEEYIKYYDYCLRVGSIANGELETPNYDSWLRGCPRMDEEQLRRLEELQRDVRCAGMNLKVEIDRLNNLKQE